MFLQASPREVQLCHATNFVVSVVAPLSAGAHLPNLIYQQIVPYAMRPLGGSTHLLACAKRRLPWLKRVIGLKRARMSLK